MPGPAGPAVGDQLDDICAATDALYQAELNKLRMVTAEETRTREALARLSEQSVEVPPETALVMRAMGADLAWNRWVGRQKEVLNMQLANILVRKAEALRRVQEVFGRNEAALSLKHDADLARKDARRIEADRKLQAMMLNMRAGL